MGRRTTKGIIAVACVTAALVGMVASSAFASSTSNAPRTLQAVAATAPGFCSPAALRVMSEKKAFAYCKKYGDGLPRWLLPESKQRVRWKYVCKTAGFAMFFQPEIKGFLGLTKVFASRFDNLLRIPGAAEVLFC
jgi:hypothetical protein